MFNRNLQLLSCRWINTSIFNPAGSIAPIWIWKLGKTRIDCIFGFIWKIRYPMQLPKPNISSFIKFSFLSFSFCLFIIVFLYWRIKRIVKSQRQRYNNPGTHLRPQEFSWRVESRDCEKKTVTDFWYFNSYDKLWLWVNWITFNSLELVSVFLSYSRVSCEATRVKS